MGVKSAQAITLLFTTQTPSTGAATDADTLPTGLLYVNGTVNGAAVTITNITTGVYKAAVTLPSLTAGDMVSLRISATVATIPGEDCIWQDVSDTKIVSDLQDLTAAQVNAQVDTALSDYDGPTDAEMDAALAALNYPEVTVGDIAAPGIFDLRRGDTWSIPITDLGNISGRTRLWFTMKVNKVDLDSEAIAMVEETVGLLYFEAAAAGTPANGSITVSDEVAGDITISIDKAETVSVLKHRDLIYDVQWCDSGGDAKTLGEDYCNTVLDVTRAVT